MDRFRRLRDQALRDPRVSQVEVYVRQSHRRRWCLASDEGTLEDEIFELGFAVRMRRTDGRSCFGTDVALEDQDLDRWIASFVPDVGPIRVGGPDFSDGEDLTPERGCGDELSRIRDEAVACGATSVRVTREQAVRREYWFGEGFEGRRLSYPGHTSLVGEHPDVGEWASDSVSSILSDRARVQKDVRTGSLWVWPAEIARQGMRWNVLDRGSWSRLDVWVDPAGALGASHDDVAHSCPAAFRFNPASSLPEGCHIRGSYRDLPVRAAIGLTVEPRPIELPQERFRVARLRPAGPGGFQVAGWMGTPAGDVWVEERIVPGSFGPVLGTFGPTRSQPLGGSSPDWVFRRNSVESDSRHS